MIPVEYLEKLRAHLAYSHIDLEILPTEVFVPTKISIPLKSHITPKEHQIEAIEHLVNFPESKRGLSLYTGAGKTVSSIIAMNRIGYRSLVVASGLLDQWYASIQRFTDLTDEDIYVVKGSSSLMKLWNSNLQPKVIIFSLETLRPFATRKGAYAQLDFNYHDFLIKYDIGAKFIDECDENFHAIVCIDLVTFTVPINIYLSATYMRNDSKEEDIFKMVFPKHIRYGEDSIADHVNIKLIYYAAYVNERKTMTSKGYMQTKYEAQLLRDKSMQDWFIDKILVPCIKKYYLDIKKPGQKLMLLFGSVETIRFVIKRLTAVLDKNLKILSYVSGDSFDNLSKADILLGTPKGLSRGKDIAGLKTVFTFISTKAKSRIIQTLGRTREIEGDEVYLLDFINEQDKNHGKHAETKLEIYQARAKTLEIIRI
jgi:superfamily II DNA or RNA helicase